MSAMLAEFPQADTELEAWRLEGLLRLGYAPQFALRHARDRVDLHELEQLLEAGCSQRTAWRIVAPLDAEAAA